MVARKLVLSSTNTNALWLLRFYIIQHLIVVIYFKYIKGEFYKKNHDEIKGYKLILPMFISAAINANYLYYIFIEFKNDSFWCIICEHLCDPNYLLYPMCMLICLLITDISIAATEAFAGEPSFCWIWLIQTLCDLGTYIMVFVFIPVFKSGLDYYRKNGRNRILFLGDMFIAATVMYIAASLLLYMFYEDWNIEEIVKDKSQTMYANRIMENFLIFEWFHQLIEYGHHDEHQHQNQIEIDLLRWKYLGFIVCYSMIEFGMIIIRMTDVDHYLMDFSWKEAKDDVGYTSACFVELLVAVSTFLYIALLWTNKSDQNFQKFIRERMGKLKFAFVLWCLLLGFQMAYFSFSQGAYSIQFVINVFVYPVTFVWIICALEIFDKKRDQLSKCNGIMYFWVPLIAFTLSRFGFIGYGVFEDTHLMGKWKQEGKSNHLIFVIIAVENSLLLEQVHLIFPILYDCTRSVISCVCGGNGYDRISENLDVHGNDEKIIII